MPDPADLDAMLALIPEEHRKEAKKHLESAVAANTAVGEWQKVEEMLFPSGLMSSYGSDERARFGAVNAARDPITGAIYRREGVAVDPNQTWETGVFYDPNSNAAGSYQWLSEASEWDDEKVENWRKRLRDLGYDVAAKGKFDDVLWNNLDWYWRRTHFYGKEMPLDAEATSRGGVTRKERMAAYDPVAVRNDIRSTFQTIFGDDPADIEMNAFESLINKAVKRALVKGASPAHAQARAKEKFAKRFSEDPVAKDFIEEAEREEENTELRDSILSIAQITAS